MKKLATVLLFLLLAAALCLASCAPSPKIFSAGGLNITLTDEFDEVSVNDYTAGYETSDVAVLTLKEGFELLEGLEDKTVDEYAQMVIDANPLCSGAEIKHNDGLVGFEHSYANAEDGNTYHYYSYVFKSDDAFWLVQFAAIEPSHTELAPAFIDYAKSITFGN